MSWKYPRRVPRNLRALDHRDMNDGFLPFVDMFGKLGEHNWSDRLQANLVRATDLDESVGMRLTSASEVLNSTPVTLPTTAAEVANTGSWVAVEDMTKEITVDGGTLMVLASFQQLSGTAISSALVAYSRFGIALNGAVIPNSVVGDQDFYEEAEYMEIGVSGTMQGVDVEATFPVPPGTHLISLVAQVRPRADVTADVKLRVANRELIILEMW